MESPMKLPSAPTATARGNGKNPRWATTPARMRVKSPSKAEPRSTARSPWRMISSWMPIARSGGRPRLPAALLPGHGGHREVGAGFRGQAHLAPREIERVIDVADQILLGDLLAQGRALERHHGLGVHVGQDHTGSCPPESVHHVAERVEAGRVHGRNVSHPDDEYFRPASHLGDRLLELLRGTEEEWAI